jgi:GGDEF domain-containing protein
VTISVGYTTFCAGQSPSASKVTRAADIALYRAKNSGRNRIMYEPVHQPDVRHRPLLANPGP